MAQQTSEPLDEIVWRSPALYHQFFGGTLTPITALLYFRESPFFDRLSNNGSLWTQAQYNPSLAILLNSREALEARLKTMTGLEFVIAMDSPESQFYAIRKQFRKGRRLPKYDVGERPDGPDGKIQDVRVEGVFFVVGENIYPSPRVGLVLASRQLAVVTHLRNALKKAASLSNFTPSMGHYYIPPSTASTLTTTTTTTTTTAALQSISSGVSLLPPSRVTTQPPSQITTPSQSSSHLPPPQSQQTSIPQPNEQTTSQPTNASSLSSSTTNKPLPSNYYTFTELRLMPQSLSLSLKHANEYMDSSPPVPPVPAPSQASSSQGSSFSASAVDSTSGKKDPVSVDNQSQGSRKTAPLVVAAGGLGTGKAPMPGQERVPTAPPTGVPKIKRRKSKAAAVSPT